jgi:adenosyl cobinamide kinase/adenosyl cobinamide phosphate guanylyltransferase
MTRPLQPLEHAERQAVRGAQEQGSVQAARAEDHELAERVEQRRHETRPRGNTSQGGTTAQKKKQGSKGSAKKP